MELSGMAISPAKLKEFCEKYAISRLSMFGSFVHGTASDESDVDLLAVFAKPIDLFTFVRVKNELSTLFGREVDLVTEAFLSPYFRDDVLSRAQVIYEAG